MYVSRLYTFKQKFHSINYDRLKTMINDKCDKITPL